MQAQGLFSRFLRRTALLAAGVALSAPAWALDMGQLMQNMGQYKERTGRFVEAKCHTATAVSLSLGAGLHKTRSVRPMSSILGFFSDTPISLPPPRDILEEDERINGFWAVLLLHKYITIALEPPTSICGTLEVPGIQVDTPWPLDIPSSEVCKLSDIQRISSIFSTESES